MGGKRLSIVCRWVIIKCTVLDGEVAVPCNPQSAVAGSMPVSGAVYSGPDLCT